MKLIGCGTLLVAGAAAGWLARDDVAGLVSKVSGRERLEAAASPNAALARQVEQKIVALGQGETDEVRLDANELNAWIEYGLKGYFPSYVSEVAAAIQEERLELAGLVTVREVPGILQLGSWVSFLGDSTAVTVNGRLDGLWPGAGVYFIEDVQVGALQLPEALRDRLLAQLKRGSATDLPINAIAFELPPFVDDVAVRGDHVVFRRSNQRGP